ncbi:MAG: alpha/beta fold hydrolase, partial [Nitrospirota bacterium]|nr:alpha/beta fold hydrolase [Nitrospirota bacterium]
MMRSSYTSLILIHSLLVMSCTATTLPVPQQIDLLQRYPIHTTHVEGHQIAYLDFGQGPPVILLHGFGGSMWHWEQQQSALGQTHRVLTVDLLGSGLSDKPQIAYSPGLLVTMIEQFLDNLHIQRATLVGNSLGAGVAIG